MLWPRWPFHTFCPKPSAVRISGGGDQWSPRETQRHGANASESHRGHGAAPLVPLRFKAQKEAVLQLPGELALMQTCNRRSNRQLSQDGWMMRRLLFSCHV